MLLLNLMFFISGILGIYFYARFTETLVYDDLSVNTDHLIYSAVLGSFSVMFFAENGLYSLSIFFLFTYFLNLVSVLSQYFRGEKD